MFSCKFCEISKNNFSTEHLRAIASVTRKIVVLKHNLGGNNHQSFIFYNQIHY